MKSDPRMVVKVIVLRILIISAVLVSLLIQTGNPQGITDPPRAGLDFRCPRYVLAPGQPMTLHADVFGSKEILSEPILYHWEISGGKIVVGQGTSKVTIEATELPSTSIGCIDVKVRLNGGPPDLEKERSCSLKIDPGCPLPVLFGQYEDIPLKDEQQHLGRLGNYITNERPGLVVFLVAYAGKKSCRREAEWRANRAKKYLVDSYKVDASRVITVDGGYREKLAIDLITAPRDSCGPFPTPSLVGSSAHVSGSCSDKYKETADE